MFALCLTIDDMKTQESIIELQKIDCNCNDCLFMKRDFSKPPTKGVPCPINYGFCEKLNKSVSFIPTHCMLETQHCFVHRKDQGNKSYRLYKLAQQHYIHFNKLIYKENCPENILELLDVTLKRKKQIKSLIK